MMDFYQFTLQMWQTYFADLDEDGRHPIQKWIDPSCTIIGERASMKSIKQHRRFNPPSMKNLRSAIIFNFNSAIFGVSRLCYRKIAVWYMERSIFTGKVTIAK